MLASAQKLSNKDKSNLYRIPTAAFDKVININIHRKDYSGAVPKEMRDVVIRSDYTVVKEWNREKYSVQRCTYKPQIRVKVKAITSECGIELELFITNLHLFTNEGKNSLLDYYAQRGAKGNPIDSVDIIFGYAPMFAKPSLEDFYKVDMEHVPSGACGLTVDSGITISSAKGAPDSITRIHGWVTNISHGFYSGDTYGIVKPEDITKKEEFSFTNNIVGGRNFAERMFYFLIQRRFARHETAWLNEPNKTRYVAEDGFFTDGNGGGADTFGCKVIIPDGSKLGNFLVPEYKDEKGNKIEKPQKIYVGATNSVYGTLAMLNRDFFENKLRFAPLINGDWIAWSTDDFSRDLTEEEIKESLEKKSSVARKYGWADSGADFLSEDKALILPAVYSVSVSAGLCVIECPYFALINPFQKLQFNSRYNLSDDVSFFARPTNNVFTFYAIDWTLDFSTTGKENTMVIQTVGLGEAK